MQKCIIDLGDGRLFLRADETQLFQKSVSKQQSPNNFYLLGYNAKCCGRRFL